MWQTIKFRLLSKFVILSVSEVSKNGKFSLICVDFFAVACALQLVGSPFCKRLKMTRRAVIASEQCERGNPKSKNNAKFMDCHAVFAKTARNDKRKKPKNKAFKNFNVPKSASNEREREREKSPAQTLLHFHFI